MTKYYLLKGDINTETVTHALEYINEHVEEHQITIAITSEGGTSYDGRFLLQCLNQYYSKIKLVCLDKVYSSAFDIFYKFKGVKELSLGCRGMLHCDSMYIPTMSSKVIKKDEETQSSFLQLDILRDETVKMCSDFCTKEEVQSLIKGEDIYFDFNRMKKIFPKAHIM